MPAPSPLRSLRIVSRAIVGATLFAASLAGPTAAAPEPCVGVAIVDAVVSAPVVRTAAGTTFVEFDFIGRHTLCLADGTSVMATIDGHLWQRIEADGDLGLRFDETLRYGDGTLEFRGQATLAEGVWTSAVRTVGAGTGSLAGIHGQGSFWPTGPTSFGDAIAYLYP